ncbi:MAG: hypothetical protein WD645_06545 [Dehalococcoidia bacterium]
MTLGLILIPIVHWVTAIPSPFIGGYFAGVRAVAAPDKALLLGALMASLLVAPLAGALLLLSIIWLDLSAVQYIVALLLVFAFIAALGGLGAVAGGAHARRQTS